MKKYFLYARKSSDSEDRQILSIEAQLTELREYIKAKLEDSVIVEEFTESRTAKEPGRPIFNKMTQRIEKGEAQGIIAWHPDRLARNSIDGGKVIYLVDKGFIKYLDFPTYKFDNTAQGKFMLNIIFGQSKYYVDNLSENVKRGIRQKLRRGEFPSVAPYGYVNNLKTKKIDLDQDRAPKILKIYEAYATGKHTLESISHLCVSIGLLGYRSGKAITCSIVHKILTNPFYYGRMKYIGEVFDGAHEPIVTKELFDKVQEVIIKRNRKRKLRHKFVFTGLIKCSRCGGMITAETQKGHFYYRCTKKKVNLSCDLKYLREDELVNQINQNLRSISLSEKIVSYLKQQIQNERLALMKSCEEEILNTNKEITVLETKISKLMDLYLENEIPKKEFIKRKEDLFDQKYRVQKNLNQLEKGQFIWLEHLEEFINAVTTPKIVAESADFSAKREFLEKIGSNFFFEPAVITEEARAGGSGATLGNGGGSKKQVTKTKNSVRLVFSYKGLWSVLVEQTKKAAKKSAASEELMLWLGRKDSNLGMPEPKTGALPAWRRPNTKCC